MGNCATAKMFWGFPVEDEDVKEKLENWEKNYAAAKGVPEPEGGYDRDKYRAYLDKKTPVMKAGGCKVDYHGYEYGDDYVCVSASEIAVDWGESRKLDPLYAVDPDWTRKLKDFCDALGISCQEPGWYMVVHYG